MSSTVTPHINAIDQLYTLAAGDNAFIDLLIAQGPAGIFPGFAEFSFIVDAGGPVASKMSKTALTAITDGHQWNIGEGDTIRGMKGKPVDATLLRFYATGADVIRVRAN